MMSPISAQLIPFAFFTYYKTFNFPAGLTTITSANYQDYINKSWNLPTGAEVRISYDQQLKIGSLTMASGSTINHPACTSNPCAKINLKIDGNANIASGASIDAWGSGYLGGKSSVNTSTTGRTTGNTTTGGSVYRNGGTHAGYGGTSGGAIAAPYDDFAQPTDFGGGGGSNSAGTATGGGGGGAIRLDISGDLNLDGAIAADGYDGSTDAGGGAGGSIWITCKRLSSTSPGPVLSAVGGGASGSLSAGGGGGLIAVYYESLGGTMAFDYAHVTVNGGWGGASGAASGGPGILYVKQNSAAYPDIYFDNNGFDPDYDGTPILQSSNLTFGTISVMNRAKIRQLSSLNSITATATNVGKNAKVLIPDNGTVGYGVWFNPGTLTLSGSPVGVIIEY